jgi:predicted ribonuclease YlaK
MLNQDRTDVVTEGLARTQSARATARKHFVLDTNVLLHNAQSIFKFAEHEVVIPLAVIEELDTFKKNNDERGRNARHVTRALDRLRAQGALFEGVVWNEQGGSIRVARCGTRSGVRLVGCADNYY